MAVLDMIVGALGARRVPGDTTEGAQRVEGIATPGNELVDIRLVTDVPDDPIVGAVEYTMQSQRQLDDPQIGREMTTGACQRLDQPNADLSGEVDELFRGQIAQIGRVI